MSNEIKENPIFASSFISKFTHYADVDADLRENIEMETIKDISFVILPIVDQVPEKARGIIRIFVTNNTGQPITLSVRYSVIGWYSDLSKKNKSSKLGTITIKPREVWFRDISFVSTIKQGKNYVKFLFMQNRDEYASTHIEYSQIREIDDLKQIERSNFLGILSKAYINPHSLNYWIYYSIFGPYKYRKEHTFLLISKIFGFVAGGILLGLSYPFTTTTTSLPLFVLPISMIVILISILSFFSNLDASKVKLIKELELTDQERRGSLEYAMNTNVGMLKKFVRNDMNFAFDSETNTIHWKEGANKLYQRLVPDVGKMIGLTTGIGDTQVQTRAEVAVIEDKDELRKKISQGIELQHEEGIRLRGVVEAVGEESEGVEIDVEKIDSKSSIQEDYVSIKTVPKIEQEIDPIEPVPDIKQEIDPIETKPKIEQKIEPIISVTSIDKEIDPIVTETKSVVKDARGYIGEPTDVETIPVPKVIPGHKFKTADKKSVKDLKDDEE
ncbi:MAG: hypothetical protein GOP50_05355 [Candidatus Heimdallarchaeota archaeon]|nr:hypothetical protein [Candidatus Heimdallarchaeota archaeon]